MSGKILKFKKKTEPVSLSQQRRDIFECWLPFGLMLYAFTLAVVLAGVIWNLLHLVTR